MGFELWECLRPLPKCVLFLIRQFSHLDPDLLTEMSFCAPLARLVVFIMGMKTLLSRDAARRGVIPRACTCAGAAMTWTLSFDARHTAIYSVACHFDLRTGMALLWSGLARRHRQNIPDRGGI